MAGHASHQYPATGGGGNAGNINTGFRTNFGGVLGPAHSPDYVPSNTNSSADLDVDTCLKLNNYEDCVRQLDMYYGLGKIVSKTYLVIQII